jgi:hypothetical protein
MRTDSENVSAQAIAHAEHRVEIATAKLAVAESYRLFVGVAIGLLTWKIFDLNGWVAFAVGSIGFFFSDYLYSKEYDLAEDALERLTSTGKYYVLSRAEGEADKQP